MAFLSLKLVDFLAEGVLNCIVCRISLGHALQLLQRKIFLNGVQKLDSIPFKQRRQVEQVVFQPYLHFPNREVAYY